MAYPVIGIRPVIDGRWGGVRESLEEQTMNMAKSAKELIESNLKYRNGENVKCIIADTTIGGGAEAAKCEEKFSKENVTATLTVTPCWCYGSETMDLNPNTIKAVWGFNGTERPGAVYLAAVMAAYAQKGLPAFSIYGHEVQDQDDTTIPEDVKEKILRFVKAAVAVGEMKDKSYVNIGSIAMGIAGSEINSAFFQKYLGMRVEWVDMVEILRRMKLEIYDKEEFEVARKWVSENCKVGYDMNENLSELIKKSKVIDDKDEWDFVVKHCLIVNDILFGNKKLDDIGWHEEALGKNAIAGGFQGQRQWTDWLPNADFTEAITASSFNWNGAKEPVAFATENDTLNGASMLFGNLITNKAAIFSDVRTFWSPEAVERVTGKKLEGKAKNGVMHLLNSGASALDGSGGAKDENGNSVMKEYWNMTEDDIKNCLEKTRWDNADRGSFRGGGFSSDYTTDAEMPLTAIRLNIVEGVGPTLQIAEGWSCKIDTEIDKTLQERTNDTWPSIFFAPRIGSKGFESVYDVMAHWGANHCASVYGHVGADLITLASMLRIPVVYHNVPNEEIFRPHSFTGFGTKDLEGADFRACKYYGPRYK
ncbi:MAG: L-fucose isomerase [Peptoniphilaceae bacterium]|nr:L-fucose isomerase [Peptoniphilaceae bacterium]MDY3737967.1 L-fucose isomerase [Peptoniphilaceae bacterium]